MTDMTTYMSDWNVAAREYEDRKRHIKSCMGCTWCAGAVPAAEAVAPVLSRETVTAKWDNSPLVAAAATGDVDWVKELLTDSTDVNEFSSAWEYSPLIVAAQKGHVEIVRLLLQTGVCDLAKKHMEYISALDSALHGYCNLDGCEEEFVPEIRAMIIRAHMETADRIDLDTLLHIEASGAVVPEHIKAFRSGMGARLTGRAATYLKAEPGKLNLNDPPASKMTAVILAAGNAARRIAAEKAAADAAAAGAIKLKKKSGTTASYAPRAESAAAAATAAGCYDDDEDADCHPMRRRKAAVQYDPTLDDCYGKMSRRFNF